MKYIPKKGNFPLQNSLLNFSDDRVIKISDIDPIKVIEKFGKYQSGTAIGFLDEEGVEYNIIVGTNTSPITFVIIQGFLPESVNPSFYAPTTIENNESKKLYSCLLSFVSWIKTQGVLRHKEGD